MGMENNEGSPPLEERGRKSSKPLMEKRRRARINQSLNELKTLILEAMKKDTSCYSKLEKADILEMTVRYLRTLKTRRFPGNVSSAADPDAMVQYRAGYNECATEVTRYFMANHAVDVQTKTRVLSHLANACRPSQGPATPSLPPNPCSPIQQSSRVQIQHPVFPIGLASTQNILHNNPAISTFTSPSMEFSSSNIMAAPAQYQIVPGQLANGKLAAVLVPSPASGVAVASLPQLIPVLNKPTVDFQPLQGFQFPSPAASNPARQEGGDTVWRPW